jgi:23S rRNA (cytosine1962-C5)-methyltransferase
MNDYLSSYRLLDSGDERRVEQYGDVILIRPHKRACWSPQQKISTWKGTAHAEFDTDSGAWKVLKKIPEQWLLPTPFGRISLRLQKSNQIGVFPEHLTYFNNLKNVNTSNPRVLNLFAYTGAATLFCLKSLSASEVIHVDTSKQCLSWARENLALNSLKDAPCRFIPEDALTFVARLKRRNELFDLIITDPPSFSRTKGKEWNTADVLKELIENLLGLLNPHGLLMLTSHTIELDHLVLRNIAHTVPTISPLIIDSGELVLAEANRPIRVKCGEWLTVHLG